MDLTSNEAFSDFIKDLDVDAYDADFAMFRWNTVTDSRILSEKIGGVGRITGLTVTKRGPGGIAQGLKVVGTEGSKTFSGQSQIRSVLGNAALVITGRTAALIRAGKPFPAASSISKTTVRTRSRLPALRFTAEATATARA